MLFPNDTENAPEKICIWSISSKHSFGFMCNTGLSLQFTKIRTKLPVPAPKLGKCWFVCAWHTYPEKQHSTTSAWSLMNTGWILGSWDSPAMSYKQCHTSCF
ncbi:hypothetical protein M758_10G170400 [Ceratodon purpureus]|nr:hypothetical protein M758_10G170400 [Ceratodon purpureus]